MLVTLLSFSSSGLQSYNIIPNSGFSFHNRYSGDATNGRLRICCFHGNGGGWLQVDLGHMYRLYAVANHGSQYETSNYHTALFKVLYGRSAESLVTYREDGVEKEFVGNNWDNWYQIIKRTFQHPFVARVVRFHIVSGNYPPIAMEFYGCKVFDNAATTYVTNKYATSSTSVPQLSDGDVATMLPLTATDNKNKYILSISHSMSVSDVNINVQIKINDNCDLSDVIVHLYVQQYGDLLEFTSGDYKLCMLDSVVDENNLYTHGYSCQCDYGLCEHVILHVYTTRSMQCASIVEMQAEV